MKNNLSGACEVAAEKQRMDGTFFVQKKRGKADMRRFVFVFLGMRALDDYHESFTAKPLTPVPAHLVEHGLHIDAAPELLILTMQQRDSQALCRRAVRHVFAADDYYYLRDKEVFLCTYDVAKTHEATLFRVATVQDNATGTTRLGNPKMHARFYDVQSVDQLRHMDFMQPFIAARDQRRRERELAGLT